MIFGYLEIIRFGAKAQFYGVSNPKDFNGDAFSLPYSREYCGDVYPGDKCTSIQLTQEGYEALPEVHRATINGSLKEEFGYGVGCGYGWGAIDVNNPLLSKSHPERGNAVSIMDLEK